MNSRRRLVALVLAALVSVGNVAVCEGWMPTPEARMDCCAGDEPCPMHAGGSHSEDAPGSSRMVTQGEADTCCAFSEPDRSRPSPQGFAAPVAGVVLESTTALLVPPQRLSAHWRTAVPLSHAPVPRHILLSVFLI